LSVDERGASARLQTQALWRLAAAFATGARPMSRSRRAAVADRRPGACGAVRTHPRPAAAPRRLDGRAFGAGLFAFGTYCSTPPSRVRLVPIWLT